MRDVGEAGNVGNMGNVENLGNVVNVGDLGDVGNVGYVGDMGERFSEIPSNHQAKDRPIYRDAIASKKSKSHQHSDTGLTL